MRFATPASRGAPFLLAAALIAGDPRPLPADLVFLKGGQRVEAEVSESGGGYTLTTVHGTLEVPRSDVVKIVTSVQAYKAEVEALRRRARGLFEEAAALPNDPKASNAKIHAALELLKKAADSYNEAMESYSGPAYDDLPHELTLIFQEMRIYRDRLTSEVSVAEGAPPGTPPAQEPGAEEPAAAEAPPEQAPAAGKKGEAAGPDIAALRKKAQAGDTHALFDLGRHYEGVERNDAEALQCYRKAAERGHGLALDMMGRCHYWGFFKAPVNYHKAREYFTRAAAKGVAIAHYHLGVMSYGGHGGKRSLPEANRWCEKGARKLLKQAEQGDPVAQFALCWMCREGMGVPRDPKQAVEWCRKSADSGNAQSQLLMGELYLKGTGVEQSGRKALEWYRKADASGSAQAVEFIAYLYWSGCQDVPQDLAKARECFLQAAEKGSGNAKLQMAYFYRDGHGVKKNPAEAYQWARKAADQGNLTAMSEVGYCYDAGAGVAKNQEEAIRWYRKSAEGGDFYGQYNLSVEFEAIKNYPEAVRWCLRSAQTGYYLAQHSIGYYLETGKGVSKNVEEAKRWYLMAAQQGYQPSRDRLAQLAPPKR